MPTLTKDRFKTLNFKADNQTWTIQKGVTIEAATGPGVRSTFDKSTLVNKGTIKATGNIEDAVALYGTGSIIRNEGRIIGTEYDAIYIEGASTSASGARIENSGTIFGAGYGIQLATAEIVVIINTGKIRSEYAIAQFDAGQGTTKITNGAKGEIVGTEYAIYVSTLGGRLDLTNKGTITGPILLEAVGRSDTVVNKGKITGEVTLGPGNDKFVFAGGSQKTVYGEAGSDRFDFVGTLAPAKKAAKIGDFNPIDDAIGLSKKLFTEIGDKGPLKAKFFHIGIKAADKDNRIIYDSATGRLYYDKDGKGGADQKLLARLDPGLDMTAADFLVIG